MKKYSKPSLIVVEFKPEKGYAISVLNSLILSEPNYKCTEDRTESDHWLLDDEESFWTSEF